MVDDAELLRQYAEENAEGAFAEVVRRHVDLVYSAALRRLAGDAHAAGDVTQQVFVALARQARALARGVVLPAWLYNTTRNTAVDFVRAEQRRRAREEEAHAMHELENDPTPADWDRLRPLLDAAMDELGARDREAVVLRFFAQRPFAEIGGALRVSEDAARMRVDRALEKLRARLARRGVVSTAAALGLVLAQQSVLAAPGGLAASVTGTALAAGAGTGGGTGVLAPWIAFMSTSKISTSVVALAVVAAIGTVGYEVQAYRQAREVAAQSGRDDAAARVRLQEIRQRQAAAQEALTRKQGELAAKRAEQAAEKSRAAEEAAAKQKAEVAAGDAFMARHPEVKAFYLEERRATIRGWYGGMFKRLGLTPEQTARAVELMLDEPIGRISAGTGPSAGRKTIQFSSGLPTAEVRTELVELLGETGYQEWQASRRSGLTDASLNPVLNLAADLFDTPTPLSATQAEELRRIIVEEMGATTSIVPVPNWEAVFRRTEGILSAPQLAKLERYRVGDEVRQARERARWAR